MKILNNEESDSDDDNYYARKEKAEEKLKKQNEMIQSNKNLGINKVNKSRNRYSKYVSKINTDDYIVVSSYMDGSDALRNELKISYNRMKATMHGHNLASSLEKLKSELYTPKRSVFLVKRRAQLDRIMKENQSAAIKIFENSPLDENVKQESSQANETGKFRS